MQEDVGPVDSLLEIIETVPVMVTVYDLIHDKYIYVNHRIKNVLGYQPSLFLHKDMKFVSTFIHPEDLPQVLKQNKQAIDYVGKQMFWLDTKPIGSFEFRMKHRNGSWRWLHTDRSVFLRDRSGKITHLLSASLDITDRKMAEEKFKELNDELEIRVKERTEELLESEERYQTYVSQSSEGIWRFELDAPISIKFPIKKQITLMFERAYLAECNDAMAKMYGLSKAADIIGSRLTDLLIPTDKANIDYLQSFITSGYRLTEAESHEKDKDGNDRFFENNLIGIIKDGYIQRAWGTQKDITERKELERRKNDFISIASHELKTPLTSLKLYTELLSTKNPPKLSKSASTYVKKMSYQIDKLARLVNDLLDVTKIQEKKIELHKEWFLLEEDIRSISNDLQIVYPSHKILVQGHLRKEVYADKFRINQVLVNLLVNAIKFSPKAKEVFINLKEDKKNIYILVKDFGIGISTTDQKKLSSRFFQADLQKGRGLGLGLFIVSYIIQQHGGELTIQSKKGEGSSFMFSLPKVRKVRERKTAARKLLSQKPL